MHLVAEKGIKCMNKKINDCSKKEEQYFTYDNSGIFSYAALITVYSAAEPCKIFVINK